MLKELHSVPSTNKFLRFWIIGETFLGPSLISICMLQCLTSHIPCVNIIFLLNLILGNLTGRPCTELCHLSFNSNFPSSPWSSPYWNIISEPPKYSPSVLPNSLFHSIPWYGMGKELDSVYGPRSPALPIGYWTPHVPHPPRSHPLPHPLAFPLQRSSTPSQPPSIPVPSI
jgi:hypothetical protein